MYDSIEELSEATSNAVKQYIDLVGGGSAFLLYCVDRQNAAEKQAEVMRKIAEDFGLKREFSASTAAVKETAESLHKKVHEYRINSPKFVVEMFEEGLSFLEKLCERYI